MVDLEPLESEEDVEFVRMMLRRHVRYTNSGRAVSLLADWLDEQSRFVKVIPRDYKRVLLAEARADRRTASRCSRSWWGRRNG